MENLTFSYENAKIECYNKVVSLQDVIKYTLMSNNHRNFSATTLKYSNCNKITCGNNKCNCVIRRRSLTYLIILIIHVHDTVECSFSAIYLWNINSSNC